MKNLFIFTLLTCSSWVYANAVGQNYYNEIGDAKAMLNNKLASSSLRGFTGDDYCKDESCRQQMHNPNQGKYFGNDTELESNARQRLTSDPYAANVVSSMDSRPNAKYKVNPNDPAFTSAKDYMDHSYEISHGISNKYVDCEGGNICKFEESAKQCQIPTGNKPSCYSEAYPKDVSFVRAQHVIPVNGEFGRLPLPKSMMVSQIDLPPLRRVPQTIPGGCDSSTRPMGVDIFINGQQASSIGGSLDFLNMGYSCRISIATPATSIHFNPPRQLSSILIDFSKEHYFNMVGHGNIVIHTKKEKIEMGWRDNCPAFTRECRSVKETCIEGAGTRKINGINVYMSCWKKQRTYQCQYEDTCKPIYQNTASFGECKEAKRTCKTSLLGQCMAFDISLNCSKRKCTQRNLTCGDRFFCLDGSCYNEKMEQNQDFSKSAAALAALGDAAKSFTADKVRIFSGKGASCSKKPIGFSNCCADKGWGQGLGLDKCSAEEKGLAKAKEKGLTIELGTYCAEKVLGVCIRKKKGYCQFDSKMARIVQEQGRSTLGLTFGSAKNPNCSGITPEQLQKLDFSKIDFSEFYQDLQNNMKLPSTSSIQQKIADKYKDLGAK
ncbi:type-F conjugative transfer system mating-pair stabilization protein TraN [Photobacterium damselae]|uniref:type-F conjugative transfer system mating-pair stabilization protein TraN n=1 Tax=Photobacterium damselae TaxID=38293 RepID=UPI004067790F